MKMERREVEGREKASWYFLFFSTAVIDEWEKEEGRWKKKKKKKQHRSRASRVRFLENPPWWFFTNSIVGNSVRPPCVRPVGPKPRKI